MRRRVVRFPQGIPRGSPGDPQGKLWGIACLAALLLAGCAGASGESGKASLWVTSDRGRHVLLLRTVPAGQTAMQALEGAARVKTRYGGRFVQSINGIEGNASGRRDWFYFVNGIEADRSAAEYRLHAGDVEWWDYRSWAGSLQQPVVVGAFPEPFVHGYNGRRRAAAVRYARPLLAPAARTVARRIGAASVAPTGTPVPADANLVLVRSGRPYAVAFPRRSGYDAGDPVTFVFSGNAAQLARDPALLRRRYRWP